jgi:hypothetical protein
MKDDIATFLRDLRGERIEYFANPGNGGDCLIALGAYQVFERLGLDYRLTDPSAPPEAVAGKTVVVAGGGNMIDLYRQCRDFLAPRHALARRVVILPHTITAHGDLIAEFGPHVDVICRERMSHEYVRAHAGRCGVHLMDDMAFALDVERTLSGPPPRIRMPRPIEAARYLRHYWRLATMPRPADPAVFNCFRTDREKTAAPLPADNIDLPMVLVPGTRPEFCAHIGVRDIFRTFMKTEVVNTNRLHMGVAGALVGRQVNFHDNNYGKNRAVYEFSMAGRFDNVTWID